MEVEIQPGISQFERYIIFGPYEDGGCSSVDWGWDKKEQRWVVLKRLKSENVKRIEEEVRISRCFLDIKQCVPCWDWFRVDASPRSQHCLVFEYIDHFRLRDVLYHMNWVDIARFIGQFLWVVNHFHERGIIHRDIKPGNLLLDKQSLDVRIIDFGMCIAGERREGKKWNWRRVSPKSGTLQFITPEQERAILREDEFYPSPAMDIWAVGCILLEWWVGKGPYFPSKSAQKWKKLRELWVPEEEYENPMFDITKKRRSSKLQLQKETLFKMKREDIEVPEDSRFFDFLEKMIELYPQKRWSAKKLLKHPFLYEVEYKTCFLYDLVQRVLDSPEKSNL